SKGIAKFVGWQTCVGGLSVRVDAELEFDASASAWIARKRPLITTFYAAAESSEHAFDVAFAQGSGSCDAVSLVSDVRFNGHLFLIGGGAFSFGRGFRRGISIATDADTS